MKALRIILYVLAGLVVVLLIAAIIAVRSFDLNDYKDEITAYVQERTGRTLAIEDNIEFSLFPWFAVETGGVSLSDDPDFGDRDFVTVDSLSARVRVWPLIRRRIEIGRVVLDGINLFLGTDADGRANWSSLIETAAPQAPSIETRDADTTSRTSFEQLAVEGIELRNGRILWHDTNGEVVYIVGDLALNTGPINDNDPVDVNLVFSLRDVASQALAQIELNTVASIIPDTQLSDIDATIRVLDPREQERATMTIDLSSIAVDGTQILSGPAAITANLLRPPLGPEQIVIDAAVTAITMDTGSEQLTLTGFTASSGGIDADFDLRGDTLLSDPNISGTVNLRAQSIADVFATLNLPPPDGFDAESAEAVFADADINLDVATSALTINRYTLAALGLEATGQARLDANRVLLAEISLPDFQPTATLLGLIAARLPEGVDLSSIASASVDTRLTLATADGTLDIESLALRLDNATLDGQIALDNFRAPAEISGTLNAAGLDNQLLSALFGTWLPAELVEANLGEFLLETDFDYETQSQIAQFAPLQISAYGLSGEGQLTVANTGGALSISGRAALADFSPRELLQRFELPVPVTSDAQVFRSAELAASFETDGANGEFRDIAIELDDSRITGEFLVENFADPSYRFVLRADRINVDRYLPPRRQAADSGDSTSGDRRVGDIQLASDALTNTVVSGTATVGDLRIGGMDFEQLATELAFGSGRAALTQVRTELYGGDFEGGLTIDATGESGEVHLTGNATDVEIRPLLSAMLGNAYISGTGNVGLNLTGSGNTINEALQTASGSMNVELRNGTIEGINLGHKLCEAVNSGRNLAAPAAAPDVTNYSIIRSTAIVSDGIASSADLYATTGYLDLAGRGSMRLVDQWIDNQYRAALTGSVPIAGCEDLNQTIANDPVPVNFRLTGRFPEIEVDVDISQLLADWARREIRQRAEQEIQDAIIERLFN